MLASSVDRDVNGVPRRPKLTSSVISDVPFIIYILHLHFHILFFKYWFKVRYSGKYNVLIPGDGILFHQNTQGPKHRSPRYNMAPFVT